MNQPYYTFLVVVVDETSPEIGLTKCFGELSMSFPATTSSMQHNKPSVSLRFDGKPQTQFVASTKLSPSSHPSIGDNASPHLGDGAIPSISTTVLRLSSIPQASLISPIVPQELLHRITRFPSSAVLGSSGSEHASPGAWLGGPERLRLPRGRCS